VVVAMRSACCFGRSTAQMRELETRRRDGRAFRHRMALRYVLVALHFYAHVCGPQ
jgi:hypothetical protein